MTARILPFAFLLFLTACDDIIKDPEGVEDGRFLGCTGSTSTNGGHVGYGGYPDTTASEGPECACTMTIEDDASYYVDGVDFLGIVSTPEPKLIGATTPMGDVSTKNPGPVTNYDWGASLGLATTTATAASLSGTWTGYLATIDAAGTGIDCTEYEGQVGFMIDLEDGHERPAPPADTAETEHDASTTAMATSRFRLVHLPGHRYDDKGYRALPLHKGGSARYGGLEVSKARIVDFDGASAVKVFAGGALVATLTPAKPEAAVTWYYGNERIEVERPEGTESYPEIEIAGIGVKREPVARAQGYRAASADLSVWLGIDQDFTLRLAPDAAREDVKHLMVEIPDTAYHRGFRASALADGGWRVDYEGIEGIVLDLDAKEGPDGLTLDVRHAAYYGTEVLSPGRYVIPKVAAK